MIKHFIIIVCTVVVLASCKTSSVAFYYPQTGTAKKHSVSHPGIGRIKQYEFTHKDIPPAFNGFRIVFASDLHYKSKFREKHLRSLVQAVNALQPDLFLLGGDYQQACRYVPELVEWLGKVKSSFGTIGVMGNHDYARCYSELISEMAQHNIRILEHKNDTITIGKERIIIAGVRNPFDLAANSQSPTLELSPDDFVILLTHTPDYVADVDVSNTDLALAGHTHGGQVTLFGLYAPATSSKYGQRFRTGLKYSSQNVPVIITNGLGTSRKNVRLFAPSELVVITLRTGDCQE